MCILADDEDEYYGFCGELADGSIVITDGKGNYYHAMDGEEKQYIACEHPKTQDEDFDVAVSRLKTEAETRAAKMREKLQRKKEKKQQTQLAQIQDVVPFQSGEQAAASSCRPFTAAYRTPWATIVSWKPIPGNGVSSGWTARWW